MEITSITKYKGTSYEVEVDEERKLYLHIDIINDFGLSVGQEIDEETLADVIRQSNKRKAYQYSLYLLDYRDYSYRDMFKKLEKTYKDEELCFEVMRKLVRLGMINDKRYAESLARKYVEVKKYGIYRAKQEMYRKGITGDTADNALEPYIDCAGDNIRELLEKKYSRYLSDPDDRKSIEKVKSSLVRMGYRFDDINRTVGEFLDELE